MSLPSLAGLPATPLTGHSAENAKILLEAITQIQDQILALHAKVAELEKNQEKLETQLRRAHDDPSHPRESDSGGGVLWGE